MQRVVITVKKTNLGPKPVERAFSSRSTSAEVKQELCKLLTAVHMQRSQHDEVLNGRVGRQTSKQPHSEGPENAIALVIKHVASGSQ